MTKVTENNFFGALGNKQRLLILQFLLDNSESSVSEICRSTGLEQSAVSHNLKVLLEHHFVAVSRQGKQRIYSAHQESVGPLVAQIKRHITLNCKQTCSHKVRIKN